MSSEQQPVRGRLISHFEDRPVEDHGSGWAALWDSDESDLWDRGKPSPALRDAVENYPDILDPKDPNGRRKKALVPGCGRGYDVVMLALHGFDAYGLEISSTAVKVAQTYAGSELKHPSANNFGRNANQSETTGDVRFVQGDFFQTDWEVHALGSGEKFDLIYDYTFLCALPPSLRPKWAARMAELLKPGGVLVCLEFPLYKDPKLPGPPWGLQGVYWDLLARGGDGIVESLDRSEDTAGILSGQFTRILYIKPMESYKVAKGTDMLSIYQRK